MKRNVNQEIASREAHKSYNNNKGKRFHKPQMQSVWIFFIDPSAPSFVFPM